jgi:hypothetical protein
MKQKFSRFDIDVIVINNLNNHLLYNLSFSSYSFSSYSFNSFHQHGQQSKTIVAATTFGLFGTGVTGMVSILPDFMGYGESMHYTDRVYMKKDPYVTATLPLWIQARSDLMDRTRGRSKLGNEAIFAGYSEGYVLFLLFFIQFVCDLYTH